MKAQVRNLAELIKAKRQEGSTYVLLLGAGASMDSGVPTTGKIMEELVDRYAQELPGGVEDRFDKLWRRSSPDDRRRFLEPYLDREPSPGYVRLAELVQAGCFELIVTFNFDDLVEKALQRVGFHDYKVVVRGETDLDAIARLVERPVAKLTLLKLHGSLFSSDAFLFDQEEMVNYPEPLEALLRRLTHRDVVTCGYSFRDLCVLKAFSAEADGGAVFCVDKNGVPANLKGILIRRRSQDRVIAGELGTFDRFFAALHQELTAPPPKPPRPRCNPFKFLDSYDQGDRGWFFGRRELTGELLARFAAAPPPSLHLVGAEKVGKTSFVRAGLLAHLDPEAYEPRYLRCRPDLERQLCTDLEPWLGGAPAAGPAEALRDLAASSPKHTVLVLDQFERVLRARSGAEEDWQRLLDLFGALCRHGQPRLTVLFVAVDDLNVYKLIVESRVDAVPVTIRPLKPRKVEAIVRLSACKSGVQLERRVVRALTGRLAEKGFTLAHLQAICHLLVYGGWTDWERYERNITRALEYDLDQAISACDFLNLVEDFPLREGRHLVRSLMKVVAEPSKHRIATLVKERFAELLTAASFPEPLDPGPV